MLFNLTNNASQIQSISEGLTQFWTEIGPLSPELNDTITPFISGFEVRFYALRSRGEAVTGLTFFLDIFGISSKHISSQVKEPAHLT